MKAFVVTNTKIDPIDGNAEIVFAYSEAEASRLCIQDLANGSAEHAAAALTVDRAGAVDHYATGETPYICNDDLVAAKLGLGCGLWFYLKKEVGQ